MRQDPAARSAVETAADDTAGVAKPAAKPAGIIANHVVRRGDEVWADYARAIGVALNRARHDAGLSQERLAHMAGLTRYHYQQLEKGESRPGRAANPGVRHLIALAQALDVALMDLLPTPMPDVTEGR